MLAIENATVGKNDVICMPHQDVALFTDGVTANGPRIQKYDYFRNTPNTNKK